MLIWSIAKVVSFEHYTNTSYVIDANGFPDKFNSSIYIINWAIVLHLEKTRFVWDF